MVKGLNLVTLYCTDPRSRSLPVNYRVYGLAEGQTKNDYCRDMLAEVLAWGLRPSPVTGAVHFSAFQALGVDHESVPARRGFWASTEPACDVILGQLMPRIGEYLRGITNLDQPPQMKVSGAL